MKKVTMAWGRTLDYKPAHPERTGRRNSSLSWDAQVIFQEFPNRQSLAKAIRMQQQRERLATDWKACVPLADGEGY